MKEENLGHDLLLSIYLFNFLTPCPPKKLSSMSNWKEYLKIFLLQYFYSAHLLLAYYPFLFMGEKFLNLKHQGNLYIQDTGQSRAKCVLIMSPVPWRVYISIVSGALTYLLIEVWCFSYFKIKIKFMHLSFLNSWQFFITCEAENELRTQQNLWETSSPLKTSLSHSIFITSFNVTFSIKLNGKGTWDSSFVWIT